MQRYRVTARVRAPKRIVLSNVDAQLRQDARVVEYAPQRGTRGYGFHHSIEVKRTAPDKISLVFCVDALNAVHAARGAGRVINDVFVLAGHPSVEIVSVSATDVAEAY